MTKAELIANLANLADDCPVLVDIKPWDEPLSLTGITQVGLYGGSPDDKAFAVLVMDKDGATRLDPAA